MNAQYIKGPYHTKPGCGLEIFDGDNKPLMKMAPDRPLSDLIPTMNLLLAAPELLQELKNIANADTADWDDPTDFEAWAKNRARYAIAKATGEQA